MTSTFFVTGGLGCIGAWTLYHIVRRGDRAVNFDLGDTRHRLDAVLPRAEQEAITFIQGDVSDYQQVSDALEAHAATHIIHLAALQVPMCRDRPVLGAQVNVTGTVNIFEAARQAGLRHITYASSIAVYGPPDDYPPGPIAHDAPLRPRTLYGVYKQANENTARIYWQDHHISSTALRPYTVYGVGRDQGLTSEPTKALLAASRGEDYTIRFGGRMQFHHASDVAQQFIEAALQPLDGAYVFNMGQPATSVSDFAAIVEQYRPGVTITVQDNRLPFPEAFDAAEMYRHFDRIYETPLQEGIRSTLDHFARLTNPES